MLVLTLVGAPRAAGTVPGITFTGVLGNPPGSGAEGGTGPGVGPPDDAEAEEVEDADDDDADEIDEADDETEVEEFDDRDEDDTEEDAEDDAEDIDDAEDVLRDEELLALLETVLDEEADVTDDLLLADELLLELLLEDAADDTLFDDELLALITTLLTLDFDELVDMLDPLLKELLALFPAALDELFATVPPLHALNSMHNVPVTRRRPALVMSPNAR